MYSCELIGRTLAMLNDDIEVADFVIEGIIQKLCERTGIRLDLIFPYMTGFYYFHFSEPC